MSSYLPRLADTVIDQVIADHPAVLLVGRRATGKTTTCEKHASTVLRLADPAIAAAVRASPSSVLEGLSKPILIDEWQEVPTTLHALKLTVDAHPRRGRFLVTGSVRADNGSATWPGTGRLVRLAMYGLTEREIERAPITQPSWFARVIAGDVPTSGTRCTIDLRGYVRRALRSGFPEPALLTNEWG